ncbi:FecR family protein [Pedobacter sp. ok626]|uniref:FecR family protein n=1 Tax=Pedobacter sp. ok626 TaxID=1761882 RepID=UPI00088CC8B7|nr:FecR domain-containing protein [Pedobacter sp. ok626]SDK10792.1 FecR family protein [Pedobacter sp. ok626]
MEADKNKNFVKKYNSGIATSSEQDIVESWHLKDLEDKGKYTIVPEKDIDEANEAVWKNLPGNSAITRKINWPLNILLTAAAIAILATVSTLLFKNADPVPARFATDINPGGNKAILTLKNGKTIELSAAKSGIVIDASKLAYNDGTLINNEQAQAFTVSTPLGGTYQVKLPDGSKVWLNAGSSLTYDPYLKGKEQYRNIKLSGEAYFEVAKDKKHPFVVTTDKQKIEVLGTHFNISAYIDDLSNKTSLLEGSVKVAPLTTTGSETKGLILKPGQQSEINSKGISVQEVDPTEVIAWKNGDFSFTSESLESIMQKVSRWYDVEVTYTNKKLGNKPFSGVISKYEKVSQVLCLLEATGEVKFKINGRKITVMP